MSKTFRKIALNKLREFKHEIGYHIHDTIRLIKNPESLSEVVNKKEIRIVGLRRSGNHAIINWIRKQQKGEVLHLNNVRAGKNPYRVLYHHYRTDRLRQEALGYFTKKDCLISSYEDYNLEDITDKNFAKKHDLYLGKTEQRYDVIIIRDPFNLLASRLQKGYTSIKSNQNTVIDLWIAYAKEYLGETQFLQNNKIGINYNQWFLDVAYRQQIASRLNLEFSDAGLEKVKGQGGGSSFDGLEFQGKASNMDVLGRWKNFASDDLYKKMLDNQELVEYAEKIFGHIPGTELLRNS